MEKTNYSSTNAEIKTKMFPVRIFICSLFSALAISLYLYGVLNWPGMILIFAGALWNFFVDINSMLSFILSIVVGLLYAMFCILEGLFANAVLYTAIYIPLQFYIWIRFLITKQERDMERKLNFDIGYYGAVAFLVVMGLTFFIVREQTRQVLPFFDTFSACCLALSAVLQSLGYREYYYVRPVATLVVFELWVNAFLENGMSMGNVAMMVLYLMYFLLDYWTMQIWCGINERKKLPKIEEKKEDPNKEKRLKEYEDLKKKKSEEKEQENIKA